MSSICREMIFFKNLFVFNYLCEIRRDSRSLHIFSLEVLVEQITPNISTKYFTKVRSIIIIAQQTTPLLFSASINTCKISFFLTNINLLIGITLYRSQREMFMLLNIFLLFVDQSTNEFSLQTKNYKATIEFIMHRLAHSSDNILFEDMLGI